MHKVRAERAESLKKAPCRPAPPYTTSGFFVSRFLSAFIALFLSKIFFLSRQFSLPLRGRFGRDIS